MLIGYARISTDDPYLDLQRDALAQVGCERVFEDTTSGAKAERTGLTALLATLRCGDIVVIWRLDRLGRSLKDLIHLIERLDAAGVGLHSLQENIDTTSTGGRLVFPLFGALAAFERSLIRERTQAGRSAARSRGHKGGRKKRLDPEHEQLALQLYHERHHTVDEICRLMGIGKSTLYNSMPSGRRKSIPPDSLMQLRRQLGRLPHKSPERAAQGLSITAIATELGCFHTTISQWITRGRAPKLADILRRHC
ncbi:recombinase family protein [Burkholderia sp. LA-2-3-30-S1-D2]|uniref:recombinase family protein n=1 Tax=Burkholderia sp. LA-2-3-30-S1-D2 TaxID=1637862 RepID=UPI0009E8198E